MAQANKIFSAGALFSLLLSAQNGGSLSGSVTSSTTGLGIQGVPIQVCPTGSSGTRPCETTHYQALTDLAGAFRIAGIPDGSYTVVTLGPKVGFSASKAGNSGAFATVTVAGDSRLDLQMTPFASVRAGRCRDH
jgi:hypothetical protein